MRHQASMREHMNTLCLREIKQTAAGSPTQAEAFVQVESSTVKPTKSGGEFLELKIADAEEHCTLRVWSDAPIFADAKALPTHAFIAISGEWSSGQYGLEAKQWQMRPLLPDEIATLLGGPPALREKQASDFSDLQQLTSSISDPRLHALCALFLSEFGERFRRTGAAREYHHARRGGLVEHVAQMMRTAAAVCSAYQMVNRDLVITGVLFHDCGKLWENCFAADGFHMPYSEPGELLGHIPLGIELVNRLWRQLSESPANAPWKDLQPPSEDVRLHLLHLIAAHHGEYQFGSPVLPKTPEAIVLHHVDNIDAKLEMMFSSYQSSPTVGRNIFERTRPLTTRLVRPLATFPTDPPTD
jgi:3'-5' exoribonuclease